LAEKQRRKHMSKRWVLVKARIEEIDGIDERVTIIPTDASPGQTMSVPMRDILAFEGSELGSGLID
jgi:hypothetical protein